MNAMQRIRAYHVTLATLTILAFVTGDFGFIHDILGYAVGAVIVLRLLWAVFNPSQIGLNRFHADFPGLRFDRWLRHPGISQTLILAIAFTLSAATVTGLMIDPAAEDRSWMLEIHESFSNLLVLLVILHALYMLAFKRPLAKYMLYRDRFRAERVDER